jgi:galactitol-specific phosphotransferase system IIB component
LTGKPDLTGYQTSTQVASAIQTAIANLASKSDVASAVANFVTSAQVQTAIAAALNTSGFQSASQVNALIAAALADLDVDTEIFVTVSELPDADAADTNKIYIQTTDMTEWRSTGTAWDALGGVSLDLEGYYNEDNFTEITAEELQDIWDEA